MALAAPAVPDADPDAARLLVPEIAVTEAELDAEAEADAAEADEEAEADEDAEALELAALQLGLVSRVTPALLQRDEANLMVASHA